MAGGWTSTRSMIETIDEALASMQFFPYGSLYESLCRQKAMLLFEAEKKEEAIAYLTESFGVSLRQKFISKANEKRAVGLAINKSSADQTDRLNANTVVCGLERKLLEFGGSLKPDDELGFKTRLASLPSEWTVVQISQMDCGPTLCPPRSIPKEISNTKAVMISRHGCGSKSGIMDVKFVSSPWPLPCSQQQDILAELRDIVKCNANISKSGPASTFWQRKASIESRFSTVLDAIKDWLAEVRCWLLGRIVNPKLEAEVEEAVKKLAKKLNISDEHKLALNILVNGSACLSKEELKKGLDPLIPVAGEDRDKQLQMACDKIRSLACTVMGESRESITFTPRHNVILITDKVLYTLPWERLDILRKHPVSRVPCLAMAHAMHTNPNTQRQLDSQSTFFVLDPDNNLPMCAQRLELIFLSRPNWNGTIRKAPTKQKMGEVLSEEDIYLYSGHGSGMNLIPNEAKCNSVAVLAGCGSSVITKLGTFWELHGAPINLLLSGSPSTLGMLWEVLDRDADRMTVQLVETWLPSDSKREAMEYRRKLCEVDSNFVSLFRDEIKPSDNLLRALWSARNASQSNFVAAAFVANGLPMQVFIKNKK